MKLSVFAVYDEKAAAFMQPFFMNSRGEATRAFGDAVVDPQHAFNKHASDFSLYVIGEYDQGLGQLIPMTPEPLVRASSFVGAGAPRLMEGNSNAHAVG